MKKYGTGILEREIEDHNVTIDGRKTTISATVSEKETHETYNAQKNANIIYTNPADILFRYATPSLSLVRFAKVKHVIDGVYAAIEKRIHEKGHLVSRTDFLEQLERVVDGDAQAYIATAREAQKDNQIAQGFYSWTPQLENAFKQIKILAQTPSKIIQSGESDKTIIQPLYNAINENQKLAQTYEAIKSIYAQMTEKADNTYSLFPPANLPDQVLLKLASEKEQSNLEEGLGNVLIRTLKKNPELFKVTEQSGLYTRQMQEILPLVLQNTPEFKKWVVNEKYSGILEQEFVSQWAGTRHTHVGHYDYNDVLIGCYDIPENPISISPQIDVEPLATSYNLMSKNIHFLYNTIQKALPEVLDQKRVRQDESRSEVKIGEELLELKHILRGLAAISWNSIHIPFEGNKIDESIKKARGWVKNISNDPDVNRNTAIITPIIRTSDGSKQICYINAGFKIVEVTANYEGRPKIKIDGEEPVYGQYELTNRTLKFPTAVHREVRINPNELINDKGLRSLLQGSFDESELDRIVEKLEE